MFHNENLCCQGLWVWILWRNRFSALANHSSILSTYLLGILFKHHRCPFISAELSNFDAAGSRLKHCILDIHRHAFVQMRLAARSRSILLKKSRLDSTFLINVVLCWLRVYREFKEHRSLFTANRIPYWAVYLYQYTCVAILFHE